MKVIHRGQSFFVDLMDRKILSTNDMLELLNECKKKSVEGFQSLDGHSAEEIAEKYLNALKRVYRNQNRNTNLVEVYNHILDGKPLNLKELGERALLLKSLGEKKLARIDIKRYFSFVNSEKAPAAMVRAKEELGH